MTQCFGYIRVSTTKQGEQGVSLQEQRTAIERYAAQNSIKIVEWFEEQETAAKRGRPVFLKMLKLLRKRAAAGVIIHKIDRSARNLRDWADLGELIDVGVAVHFANESIDLHTRGGRLSADIQAVVASDFIRNLRDETKKGFYGRLKQGLYPLPAPLGYVNQGGGKPKAPDPKSASLVRRAFELYDSGRYTLLTLGEELDQLGLRNRRGGRISLNGLSTILNNSFYTGLIRIARSGETFSGAHPPLISKSLFDRVQARLKGKAGARLVKHDFPFKRLLSCAVCGKRVVGERQKGHVYYRCHTPACAGTCIREEAVDAVLRASYGRLALTPQERVYFDAEIEALAPTWKDQRRKAEEAAEFHLATVKNRLHRLTDAFLDGTVDKVLFEERKRSLLEERVQLEEGLHTLASNNADPAARLKLLLELCDRALFTYEIAPLSAKRAFVCLTTSNRIVYRNEAAVELSIPFLLVANRSSITYGDPYRGTGRTLKPETSDRRSPESSMGKLVAQLTKWVATPGSETLMNALRSPSPTEEEYR